MNKVILPTLALLIFSNQILNAMEPTPKELTSEAKKEDEIALYYDSPCGSCDSSKSICTNENFDLLAATSNKFLKCDLKPREAFFLQK